MAWKQYPSSEGRGDSSGNVEELIGNVWYPTKSAGADIVKVDNTQPVTGTSLYTPLLGSSDTLVLLPSNSGDGPDTYIVDLAQFNSTSIYFTVICETGTVTHSADVEYSNDGGSLVTATEALWAAGTPTAGNVTINLPKKGRFAHITLTQVTGTAEPVWAYISGREVA